MKNQLKSAIFLLVFSMAALVSGAFPAAAGVDDIKESLRGGAIAEKSEGTAPEAEKLTKILEEIRREEPGIDSASADATAGGTPAAGESSSVGSARAGKNAIYESMFRKAYGEFERGDHEASFSSFKNIYSEFARNSKALYFMTLCRSRQGKTGDALEMASELLTIVRERNASMKLREAIDRELEAFGGTDEAGLTAGLKKELNEKIGACLKRIESLYPSIDKIPEGVKKPKGDENSNAGKIGEYDYDIARERLRKLRAAAKLYENGEYEKAYAAFEKIHAEFPANMRALYFMALCMKKLDRPAEAAKILSKVSKIIKNRQDVKRSAADIADELETAVNRGDANASATAGEEVDTGSIAREDMTIKVISYNIAKGQGPANDGGKFVGKKYLDLIVRLLKDEKADLIGMQEVDNNRATTGGVNQADFIAGGLGMDHFWHEASAAGPKDNINEHGNAVLSEHKMLKKHYVEFKSHGAPGAKPMFSETRGLSHAVVDFGGAKVNFISTHFGFPEGARVGQAKELVEYVKNLEGPVVLVGDFNTRYSDKSESYRIINKALDNSYDLAKAKGGKNGVAPHKGFIDFVFVTPGVFECESVCLGGKRYEGASDHRPNITVLKFKKD